MRIQTELRLLLVGTHLLQRATRTMARLPVAFVNHGGGPCFFLPEGSFGPPGTWTKMRRSLESLVVALPQRPEAVLMCARPGPCGPAPALRLL